MILCLVICLFYISIYICIAFSKVDIIQTILYNLLMYIILIKIVYTCISTKNMSILFLLII